MTAPEPVAALPSPTTAQVYTATSAAAPTSNGNGAATAVATPPAAAPETAAPPAPAATAPAGDRVAAIRQRLAEVKALHDDGLLEEAEYKELRAAIIAELQAV